LKRCIYNILISTFLLILSSRVYADPLQESMDVQTKIHQAAEITQKRVNQLSEDTSRLIQEYKEVLSREENLRLYNDQLGRMIDSQEDEIASFDRQLHEIEVTRREIIPLMMRMISRLEQFISLDRPFLIPERVARVAALRKLIDQPDIMLSEKYRRVMEAYQLEVAYGRTIEARTGLLDWKGKSRTVHFLRVGRVSLLYLSLDGKEAGYWDVREKNWKKLPEDYIRSIEHGLRVARKESPPDLLKLPISVSELSQ